MDEKRGQQIWVSSATICPSALVFQRRTPLAICSIRAERRVGPSADNVLMSWSGDTRRRCDGLEVRPETGSSSLAPGLTKGFHERIEVPGEDG
jgi:hypothetical protein